MNFWDFRRKCLKSVDSLTDVLVFNHFAVVLAFLICKVTKSRYVPYILTVLSLLFRIVAGFLFFVQSLFLGVVFIIIGYVLDGADGQVSRIIFGKDPEARGTLDFVFDHIAVIFVYTGIGSALFAQAPRLIILYIILLVSHLLLLALISTKFRLYALQRISPDKTLVSTGRIKGGLNSLVSKVQSFFRRYSIVFHPSIVDSNFVVWILFPLFHFNVWLLLVGILFIWADAIITGFVPIYFLVRG